MAATESGTLSTATTRGRRSRGRPRTKRLTDSAAALLVSTTVGCASVSTASSRSEWPGSSGANKGTAMFPASMAAKKPTT
ncbi:Uncharacterised protein [Mycobacteroides abscessus subsp. abscessus]|nr:Uncharacterised protein [Mycobacteroides abscessus subsp. abscessus]